MALPMRMRPQKDDWVFVLHDGAMSGMPEAFMGQVMAVPYPGVQHDDEVWAWIYQKSEGPFGEAAVAIMRKHIVAWAIVTPPP